MLLAVCLVDYYSLQSANTELDHYQRQQEWIGQAVQADFGPDMQAARAAWVQAHPDEITTLGNEGILVEADYVATANYSAVIDPANSGNIIIGSPGDVGADEVEVSLGQYYDDNLSRASDWSATYIVNQSTHSVSGLTSALAQDAAYDYYTANIAPTIDSQLGVADGQVISQSPATLSTIYLPDTNTWLDVTEYRYSLKSSQASPYLTIKTYVNGTTEEVTGVDISRPYYTSESAIPRDALKM